jgi:hypothetical protein
MRGASDAGSHLFECRTPQLDGLAFDARVTPLGAKVPAMFASDLGHWDVPDFDEPLEEAFELVERGILDTGSFREFVCTNPRRFYSSLDPSFFAGTAAERTDAANPQPSASATDG